MQTLQLAVTALFWLAVLVLVFGTARRAGMWARGRRAPIDWLGLLKVPKRYLVDVHHVVARDPFISRTHMATAGGAVAALLLVAVNYGLLLYSPWLDWLTLLAAAVMAGGVVFVWLRRRNPPARLSRGPWNRLPYTLGAFAVGLLLVVLLVRAGVQPSPVVAAGAALLMLLLLAGSAELSLGVGTGSPMKHAVAGLLHLAFHPRPERFAGLSTGLKPLNLEAGDFGVEKPADFRWNQLLSFDACVQCGKCEAACPAFAAGQPLNPKKLIQDLVVGMAGGTDGRYAGSPSPGLAVGSHFGAPTASVLPGLIEPETLWSCTTCRACVEECPMLIEHVDAVVDLRRNLTLTTGEVPGSAPQALANLRETATIGGFDVATRQNWAVDLDVPSAAPGRPVEVLLVAGEGAFDMRYQRTLRALVKSLKAAKVDFAVLGDELDTGDTARRLGDEATFQSLARRNIEALGRLSFGRIVTADPHVFNSLKNDYPALGGHYTVVHHTTLLAELAEAGRLHFGKAAANRPAVTYHDPCYLARYNGETDAPRALLRGIGVELKEMERSGRKARCCGAGGGAALTDIPGKRRIPDMRMDDARATGAEIVAVACPNCTAMLEGVVGPRPVVLDIAELMAEAIEVRA